MGKSNRMPQAPSAEETAAAQFRHGNLSIFGPNGNLVYGRVGPDGRFQADPNATEYSAQIQETDFQRSMREAQESGSLNLLNELVGQGLPDRPAIQDTSDIARNTVDSFMYQIAPRRAEEDQRFLSNLSNRGIPMTGEAGSRAMSEISRNRGDQDAQIMRTAYDRAGSEQSRMYGLGADQRQRAMAELMAALSGNFTPTPMNVNAPGSSGVNMADLMQRQYNNELGIWQQGQNNNNAVMGTAGNLLMTLLCDRDAKTGIEPAGAVLPRLRQLDIFTFRYKPAFVSDSNLHIGPMAQQFRELFGVGDGRTIHVVDVVGVALAALKEIAEIVSVAVPAEPAR